MLFFRDPGGCRSGAPQDPAEGLPGKPLALAAPAVEPFERTFTRPLVKPPQRPRVPSQTVVVVVPHKPPVQAGNELPAVQMPVQSDPLLDPPARTLQLLARGAPHDPFPTGTSTPQDTPSFARRDNVTHEPR